MIVLGGNSMNRYIALSFAFMALAFYELSGGSDYEPRIKNDAIAPLAVAETELDIQSIEPVVSTRQSSTDLVVQAALTVEEPEKIAPAPKPSPELATFANPVIVPKEEVQSVSVILTPSREKTEAIIEDAPVLDVRSVTGNRVNMRGGPGTTFSVVTKLVKGDEVEVLSDIGDGWLKLRVIETGDIGYMADWLVTAAN